ncbi:hypothetical protein HOG21_01025 [bacterium]|nr:hypothetical protein [bacterium]
MKFALTISLSISGALCIHFIQDHSRAGLKFSQCLSNLFTNCFTASSGLSEINCIFSFWIFTNLSLHSSLIVASQFQSFSYTCILTFFQAISIG